MPEKGHLLGEQQTLFILQYYHCVLPVPFAARSKTWVCGRSLNGIVGSNPTGGMDVCLVSVVCCLVEVYATG